MVMKRALGAVVLFGALSAAHAACEPGVFDPARGVKAKDCYSMAEMNRALKAYGQRSLISGDRVTLADRGEKIVGVGFLNIFTSNEDGSLGFNIEADKPGGQQATEAAVRTVMTDVRLWDKDRPPAKPDPAILGARLVPHLGPSGDRVLLSAKSGSVHLAVVTRSATDADGSFVMVTDQAVSSLGALAKVSYTPRAQELLAAQRTASR